MSCCDNTLELKSYCRQKALGNAMAETYLHFTINRIPAIGSTCRPAIVSPASTSLSVGTITGHVSRVTTNTADDAGSVVLALGTVVLAVANLATVLASLVLVIS